MLPLQFAPPPGRPLSLLAIGAHPDDIEIGAGGTLLTLAESQPGLEVRYLVLTGTAERQLEARRAAAAFLPGTRLTLLPPEVGTPGTESPDGSALHEANTLQQKYITVKSVELLRSGQRKNGGAWKLSKVLATDGVSYTTFAGHRYEVGKEYTIEYEEKQSGSFIDYRIKEPK